MPLKCNYPRKCLTREVRRDDRAEGEKREIRGVGAILLKRGDWRRRLWLCSSNPSWGCNFLTPGGVQVTVISQVVFGHRQIPDVPNMDLEHLRLLSWGIYTSLGGRRRDWNEVHSKPVELTARSRILAV